MGKSHFRMDALEFAIQQIKTDGDVSPQIYEYLQKIAKEWGIAVTNIAWLQMKPYPMQGGLYQMLKNKCEKEGLIVKSMIVKSIKRAETSDKRAGFESEITLFDQRTFDEIMKKATLDKLSVEMLRETRDMLTHYYKEEGWASLDTVRAPAMQNPDYLNHMSATRAIDRALRMIVRCPFTAASELPQGEPGDLVAGIPGIDSPPGEGGGQAPILIRPGQKAPVADKPEEGEAKPGAEAAKPEKLIPQKTIKKIEEKKPDPKGGAVSDKQSSLLTLQWEGYCKDVAKGITKKEIDEKLPRLIKALYGKASAKDLTVAELEEIVGLMARKEIEVAVEGKEAPEKPEVKT